MFRRVHQTALVLIVWVVLSSPPTRADAASDTSKAVLTSGDRTSDGESSPSVDVKPLTPDEAVDGPQANQVLRPFSLGATDAGLLTLHYDVQSMRQAAKQPEKFVVADFPLLSDLTVDLELTPFQVAGRRTRVVRGHKGGADEPLDFDPTRIAFFRGQVRGRAGSHVFLAFSDTISTGSIDLGPGAGRHVISNRDRNGQLLPLGRLSVFEPRGGAGLPVGVPKCGVTGESIAPLQPVVGAEDLPEMVIAGPVPHLGLQHLELAVETDYEYFSLFGNIPDATTYAFLMYGAISDIYMRDVNTRIELVFVRIWDDPNDIINGPDPLQEFRAEWLANPPPDSQPRDNAQFFSGRRDFPFGGQAFLSSLCNSSIGFGVVGYALGFFPDPSRPDPYTWDLNVSAHELGHSCGAHHTHDLGLDECDDPNSPTSTPRRGSIMAYCSQTWSGMNSNDDLFFHTSNRVEMRNHIFSRTCIANDCNGNNREDTTDIALLFSADVNGNNVPDECEDCQPNGTLDPADIAAVGDAAADDQFGYSVDIHGDTALVGSPFDDGSAGVDQGSVYVFVHNGSDWIFQAKLTAGDATADAQFGDSVVLQGNTALVGAPGDDLPALNQGSAYVFVRSGTTWSQQAKLTAADGTSADFFGDSVAYDFDTAVVGARNKSGPMAIRQGAAYVFVRGANNVWDNGSLDQQAKLTASDAQEDDALGISVAVLGDSVLVGANGDDDFGTLSGSAYVFVRGANNVWDNGSVDQQAKLTASDASASDQFGHAVALSGDTALVGAPFTFVNRGAAYVFVRGLNNVWDNGSLDQQARLTGADTVDFDGFGFSVALIGNTALVGAYTDDGLAGGDQGSAYVFDRGPNGVWDNGSLDQRAKLTASDAAAGDQFGYSVAFDVFQALVGAPLDDGSAGSNQGSAYVFYIGANNVWDNGSLDQQAMLTGSAGASTDFNGNNIPDECEADCNNNTTPDDRDIQVNPGLDAYGDGIPDSCEEDCNLDSISDYTEINQNMALDVDRNARLDSCQDCDGDTFTDHAELQGAHNLWVASGLDNSDIQQFFASTGVAVNYGGASVIGGGQDLIVTSDGRVLVTSALNNSVVRYNAEGGFTESLVTNGSGGLSYPTGLILAPSGSLLVSSRDTNSVLAYDAGSGDPLGAFVTAGDGGLVGPFGLTFGPPNGNLFVTSATNEVFEYHGTTGGFLQKFVTASQNGGLSQPRGLVFKSDGNLLVASYGTDEVLEYEGTTGAPLGKWAKVGTATAITQDSPWGIRIGPNGNVYVTRTGTPYSSSPSAVATDVGESHLTDARMFEFDVCTGNHRRTHIGGNDHGLFFATGFDFRPGWTLDCNRNQLQDDCDLANNTSQDVNENGVPDECEVDCNGNTRRDNLDLIPFGASYDCNCNRVPDECDVMSGASDDCDGNLVPDECEDCNGNTLGDACDVPPPSGICTVNCSTDCNANGTPDECEPARDCNNNTVQDICELFSGAPDCNGNGWLDSCEAAAGGLILSEDFEGGLPLGWTASGIFQVTGACPVGAPCSGTQWAYAGDVGTCTYGDNEFGELIAPPIALAQAPAELRYCSYVDTEAGFDFAEVLVNGQVVAGEDGAIGVWRNRAVDLTPFNGQSIVLTFRFASDTFVSGTLGWQVDNIQLTSGSRDCDGDGVVCDVDCNGNGVSDECDIADCTTSSVDYPGCDDCNLNGVPDECDITLGTSLDVNVPLGVPDECAAFTAACANDNWTCFDNWDIPGDFYPDDVDSAAGISVNLPNGSVVVLDESVVIRNLWIQNGGELQMTTPDTSIDVDQTIQVDGTLTMESCKLAGNTPPILTIRAGGKFQTAPCTSEGDPSTMTAAEIRILGGDCSTPPCLDGGRVELEESISFTSTGVLILDGSMVAPLGNVSGIAPPPKLSLADSSTLNVAGALTATGVAESLNASSAGVFLQGDWDNQLISPSLFNWTAGRLTLDGSVPQSFEVAGIDLGPTREGYDTDADALFDTARHKNFSTGTLEVAAGGIVEFRNGFANTVGTGPCEEALYVGSLILEPGAQVTLDNVVMYHRSLTNNGATITKIGCGDLLPVIFPNVPVWDPAKMSCTNSGADPTKACAVDADCGLCTLKKCSGLPANSTCTGSGTTGTCPLKQCSGTSTTCTGTGQGSCSAGQTCDFTGQTCDLVNCNTNADCTAVSAGTCTAGPPGVCLAWPNNNPEATTRSLRFRVVAPPGPPGPSKLEAIKVTMVDLQHPKPANLPTQAPTNMTTYDTKLNSTCAGATASPNYNGHHCDVTADCDIATGTAANDGTCTGLVGCTADPPCTDPLDCTLPSNVCGRWVGKPGTFYEAQGPPQSGPYRAARLQCTPYYFDWKPEGLITVVGGDIAPSSEYSAQVYGVSCMGAEANCTNVSSPVTMYTRRSGDVEVPFNPPSAEGQPNVTDIAQLVNKVKSLPGAPVKAISQLQPNLPEMNTNINVSDIVAVVDAVKLFKYPYSGPCPCPSLSACGALGCATDTACRNSGLSGLGAGALCVKTCTGPGPLTGEPCLDNTHCVGSGTCGAGFCRDRCGRCTP